MQICFKYTFKQVLEHESSELKEYIIWCMQMQSQYLQNILCKGVYGGKFPNERHDACLCSNECPNDILQYLKCPQCSAGEKSVIIKRTREKGIWLASIFHHPFQSYFPRSTGFFRPEAIHTSHFPSNCQYMIVVPFFDGMAEY